MVDEATFEEKKESLATYLHNLVDQIIEESTPDSIMDVEMRDEILQSKYNPYFRMPIGKNYIKIEFKK